MLASILGMHLPKYRYLETIRQEKQSHTNSKIKLDSRDKWIKTLNLKYQTNKIEVIL